MKKEKLILICVAIIAISIIGSQVIKQNSIERQANLKLEYQKEQDRKIEADKAYNKIMVENCLDSAETAYWDYMELNGTKNKDGSITALTRFWDEAKENKKDAIDLCYKKYPNN